MGREEYQLALSDLLHRILILWSSHALNFAAKKLTIGEKTRVPTPP
jgi:hypothetical protein